MPAESSLRTRSHGTCEMCASEDGLTVYDVRPHSGPSAESGVFVCRVCAAQISDPTTADETHWRCLNNSMWSEIPAVQVIAYRMLKSFPGNPWAMGLLEQLYLDETTQKWADAGLSNAKGGGLPAESEEKEKPPLDSNGTALAQGDSVTLIKDLDVKGANFTAKRGTLVKNINLTGDPKFVEGKVNGTTIVLVTAYLKKA